MRTGAFGKAVAMSDYRDSVRIMYGTYTVANVDMTGGTGAEATLSTGGFA